MTNPKINLMLGIFAGGIAGAVTALLYAPKSGRMIRRDISHKTDELLGDASKYLGTVKTRASEIISDGKSKLDYISKEVGKIYNSGNHKFSHRGSNHSRRKTHPAHNS